MIIAYFVSTYDVTMQQLFHKEVVENGNVGLSDGAVQSNVQDLARNDPIWVETRSNNTPKLEKEIRRCYYDLDSEYLSCYDSYDYCALSEMILKSNGTMYDGLCKLTTHVWRIMQSHAISSSADGNALYTNIRNRDLHQYLNPYMSACMCIMATAISRSVSSSES